MSIGNVKDQELEHIYWYVEDALTEAEDAIARATGGQYDPSLEAQVALSWVSEAGGALDAAVLLGASPKELAKRYYKASTAVSRLPGIHV